MCLSFSVVPQLRRWTLCESSQVMTLSVDMAVGEKKGCALERPDMESLVYKEYLLNKQLSNKNLKEQKQIIMKMLVSIF